MSGVAILRLLPAEMLCSLNVFCEVLKVLMGYE